MTATVILAGQASGLDASPLTKQDVVNLGGSVRIASTTFEVATTSIDETNDTVLFLQLPSNASLKSLKIMNDDLDTGGTAGAVDIGIFCGPDKFKTSAATTYVENGIIDQDAIAAAITQLTAAVKDPVELRFEAADINTINMQLWELAGLPEDPRVDLRIGMIVTTAMTTAAAGTVSVSALFTVS